MRKKPSGLDVARRAGVSLTTVSFVMNERTDKSIPTSTRERVLRAARELGYRPNGLVRALVRGRTQTIGVLVPRLDSSFHATIIQGIQEICTAQDYRVLLADSQHAPDLEARQIDLLLEHRVDGLISVAVAEGGTFEKTAKWHSIVKAEGMPLVIVDDHSLAPEVDCVVTDDFEGARLAVQHLLRLEHRRIAHLSAGFRMTSARNRHDGYMAALQSAGVGPDTRMVIGNSYFMKPEELQKAIDGLLELPEAPTALFAANDDLAAEVLGVIRQRGGSVPEDMALVGYGNTELGRHLDLTTVHQDPLEMGRRAALRLFARLQDAMMPFETSVLPTRLIVRESCGSAPTGTSPLLRDAEDSILPAPLRE